MRASNVPIRLERELTTSDGVKLVWLDYGPERFEQKPDGFGGSQARQDGDEGPVVVLCHGLGAGADQFDADAHAFAQQGFRVLVPDLRGHGRSGRPDPAIAANYAISRMALDLVEMLDAAGTQRVDYVGNSLGGILALSLLEYHADRFRTLTTFGTATALSLPGFTAALVPWSYRLVGKRLAGKVAAWSTTPNPQGRPIIERLIADFDPQVGRAIANAVSRYDFNAHALGFAGPYLMVCGDKDRQVNAALKKALPALRRGANFTLVDLVGAGHCANLDSPQAFRDTLLDFWARHARGDGAPLPLIGSAASAHDSRT